MFFLQSGERNAIIQFLYFQLNTYIGTRHAFNDTA